MKTLNVKLKSTKSKKKDKEFGNIIYLLKNTSFSNIFQPILILLLGGTFIFFSSTLNDSDAFFVIGMIILLIGLYILGNFLFDRLYFYENGFVQSSLMNSNKVRIPYQKIKSIQLVKRTKKNKIEIICYKFFDKENQLLFEVEETSYQNLKKIMNQIHAEFKK